MFCVLGTAAFLTSNKLAESDSNCPFFIFGCVMFSFSLIFFLAGFFNNLAMVQYQKEEFNNYFSWKRKKKNCEKILQNIKTEFEEYFTKTYPEYEKEIFAKMSPVDAESLSVYIAKYPELKFNCVMESFDKKVTTAMNCISGCETEMEDSIRKIKDRRDCNWFLFKVSIPKEIKDQF